MIRHDDKAQKLESQSVAIVVEAVQQRNNETGASEECQPIVNDRSDVVDVAFYVIPL